MSALNVLLLCNLPSKDSNASTVTNHITAFQRYSRHNVFRLSKTGALPSRLDLDRFDVVVIHSSIWVTNENYFAASAAGRVSRFRGLKVQFRQDEYFSTDAMNDAMGRLGIDVLYTCVPQSEIDKVYPQQALPNVRRITTLTGFVPADMLARDVPPVSGRPIDVSYRARKIPYWLGELGVEKWRIVPRFLEATRHHSLVTDLSYEEKDRLYGEKWIRLLTSPESYSFMPCSCTPCPGWAIPCLTAPECSSRASCGSSPICPCPPSSVTFCASSYASSAPGNSFHI